jgi:hypothetical protein
MGLHGRYRDSFAFSTLETNGECLIGNQRLIAFVIVEV